MKSGPSGTVALRVLPDMAPGALEPIPLHSPHECVTQQCGCDQWASGNLGKLLLFLKCSIVTMLNIKTGKVAK